MKPTENELYNEISQINSDLTRLRREVDKKNQLLNEANDQLEVLNQDLRQFSYAVSHDLRNPLLGIYDLCNVLMGQHAGIRPDIDKIRYTVSEMLEMIGALLMLGQIKSAQLKRETFFLDQLFLEVARDIQSRNPAHKITLITEVEQLQVSADKALVRVLLTNILENCWKYTLGIDQVNVRLGTVQTSKKEQFFFIQDNGPGVPKEALEVIFDPFRRAIEGNDHHSQQEQKSVSGYGIGLGTVFRIVRKHQGEIYAESEHNQGLTIFFNFGSSSRLKSHTC